MKKRKRGKTPSLTDRFCNKFGPAILKVWYFLDKHTHDFFEGFISIITFGAYHPHPYKEPEELKTKTPFYSYKKRYYSSATLADDLKAVRGDFCAVGRDIAKTVHRLEHENPEIAQAMQKARNSTEFQTQAHSMHEKMVDIQRQQEHIRKVCSHTTIRTGNTSERGDRK